MTPATDSPAALPERNHRAKAMLVLPAPDCASHPRHHPAYPGHGPDVQP